MDYDVVVGIQDTEVECIDENVLAHLPEFACEFGALGGGCHSIDGN